jgi:type II secretory pathway component GspD/PulD (secretin)
MKLKWLISSALTVAAVAGYGQFAAVQQPTPRANNVNASRPYLDTLIDAQIRLNLENDTDQVHFLRDNNDPYVVTKTYMLKNASPYEMRPYIRTAVQSLRVAQNNTTVECAKLNDGTGILLVSAEEFRFKEHINGMSIDEIVATLDQPQMTSSSGQKRYFYFPSYTSARMLSDMIRKVGSDVPGDVLELQQGKDTVVYDPLLNCVFFYTPSYSRKNIEYMLKQYDVPNNEVSVKYSVYEIYAENDGKIGADFQSWKNNEGSDIFSVGGRYRSNWTSTYSGGVNQSGSSKTQFMNFNPKWNSKYLDFLTAKGKARVLTTGDLAVRNERIGTIERRTNIFNEQYGNKIPDQTIGAEYQALTYQKFVLSGTAGVPPYSNPYQGNSKDYYRIKAYDTNGTKIDFSAPDTSGNACFTVVKSTVTGSSLVRYYLKLTNTNITFLKGGANFGQEIEAGGFKLEKFVDVGDSNVTLNQNNTYASTPNNPGGVPAYYYNYNWVEQTGWAADTNMTLYKGYQIVTKAAPNAYGFKITMRPSVCEDQTIMDVIMTNDSLIGWNSNGTPRIAKSNTVQTKIMISNDANQFYIGGLEKRDVVRSVGGVPFVKDIPFIGWLFSTESESTKLSQLVLVAECTSIKPDTKIKDGIQGDVRKLKEDINDAGGKNSWGFQQLWVDGKL